MVKKTINNLAILGGPPLFTRPRHVGQPNIGDRGKLIARINNILDASWLTNNGACVQQFEREIAELAGAKHCIATCNGTMALEVAIRVLGMQGEVLLPSFTFVATAHALQLQGIVPVFCDIEPDTCCIDPLQIEKMITPRTSGIIGVDLWGNVCNVDALADIARCYGLKLLFDSAHSFGCSCNGNMVGSFGDAAIFSFHATKFVNAFEGGAVVTNSDATAAKLRQMINFGFAGIDNVESVGTNAKMCEASAAMGLTSLESMDEFISINRRNYMRYKSNLADIPGLQLVPCNEKEKHNYQYVPVRNKRALTGMPRDDLVKVLWKENVFVRRYFYPGCHRMEPYRSLYPGAGNVLPETQRLSDEIICFPTGQSVSLEDVDRICGVLRLLVENAETISEVLPREAQVDVTQHAVRAPLQLIVK
ncbi:MAG: aminotransferase class I/II-fold pyridoxal phosphate-dependent enzyme [Gammaproteobacteria bacterium]